MPRPADYTPPSAKIPSESASNLHLIGIRNWDHWDQLGLQTKLTKLKLTKLEVYTDETLTKPTPMYTKSESSRVR